MTIVWSDAFYRSVTWKLRKNDRDILETYEMGTWRNMENHLEGSQETPSLFLFVIKIKKFIITN